MTPAETRDALLCATRKDFVRYPRCLAPVSTTPLTLPRRWGAPHDRGVSTCVPPVVIPPLPQTGALVYWGHGRKEVTCVHPGDTSKMTHAGSDDEGKPFPILAQCCSDDGRCWRSTSAGECISGPPIAAVAHTYNTASAKCASMGLTLCSHTCVDRGCGYNFFPVYTTLPCTCAAFCQKNKQSWTKKMRLG